MRGVHVAKCSILHARSQCSERCSYALGLDTRHQPHRNMEERPRLRTKCHLTPISLQDRASRIIHIVWRRSCCRLVVQEVVQCEVILEYVKPANSLVPVKKNIQYSVRAAPIKTQHRHCLYFPIILFTRKPRPSLPPCSIPQPPTQSC